MKLGWLEILLIVIASIVLTLIAIWAWAEFRTWRSNRQYGPGNRRGPRPGRRHHD